METIITNETQGLNKLPLLETAEQELARLAPRRREIARSYEVVMEICRQANVPEAARNLIDALIRISDGEMHIKVFDSDVAKVFFENEPMQSALKKRVQRWRKKLDKWQEDSGITLVRIKSGHRTFEREKDGTERTTNHPCEYRVIVLEIASKILELGNMPIEQAARKVLGELPPVPSRFDERRSRPMTTERAKKSSISFMRRALEIARDEGYLTEVLGEVKEEFGNLLSDYEPAGRTKTSYFENAGKTNNTTINTMSYYSSLNEQDVNEILNSNEDELEDASPQETSMMTRALELASRGFRIFPVHNVTDGVCSCADGAECETKGKHPRIMAFQFDATTDETKIKEWWRRWRQANIGIPTGEFDNQNTVVLDVDPKHGGFESLNLLEDEFGELPQTLTAITGSDGRHFIFSAPSGVKFTNVQNGGKLGSGLDVRGAGGFVVAAGSMHVSGNRYKWIDQSISIAEMPAWMLDKLTAKIESTSELFVNENTAATTTKANAPFMNFNRSSEITVTEGGRNNFLFSKAIGLFYNGYGKEEIGRRVTKWNTEACIPPLTLTAITKIVNSAEKTSSQSR